VLAFLAGRVLADPINLTDGLVGCHPFDGNTLAHLRQFEPTAL
jgi:hypothetical protein